MGKNEIIKSDYNKLAFELIDNLLDGGPHFSSVKFFEIVGSKGLGKSSLLNLFNNEARKKNIKTLYIQNENDDFEVLIQGDIQYDFIIVDNIKHWDQIVDISKQLPNAKILFSCKGKEELEYNSFVLQANICKPSIEEYSQLIKSIFSNSGINLNDITCNILAYLTDKTDKGIQTIKNVLKKISDDDTDEDVLEKFEKHIGNSNADRFLDRLRN